MTRTIQIVLITLALAAMTAGAVAQACPGGGQKGGGSAYGGGQGKQMGGSGGMNHQERIARLLERTDASEEQRARIQAVIDEGLAQKEEIRTRMRASGQQLRGLARADDPDEAEVRRLAEAQAAARADMMVLRTMTMSKVRAELTPEQREQIAGLHTRGGGHQHEGGPRRMGRPGQGTY